MKRGAESSEMWTEEVNKKWYSLAPGLVKRDVRREIVKQKLAAWNEQVLLEER